MGYRRNRGRNYTFPEHHFLSSFAYLIVVHKSKNKNISTRMRWGPGSQDPRTESKQKQINLNVLNFQ